MHMRQVPFFFSTRTGFASHVGWMTSMMNPAASSRAISSPIARRRSSWNRRSGCLTGLASGLTFSWCSASSLGTPGMSLGFQANISRFARRKSMSALSYAESRPAPIRTCLEESPSTRSMLFVSWAA